VRLPLEDIDGEANHLGIQKQEKVRGCKTLAQLRERNRLKVKRKPWLLEQAIEASSSGFTISDPGTSPDNPIIYASKGLRS